MALKITLTERRDGRAYSQVDKANTQEGTNGHKKSDLKLPDESFKSLKN